VVSELVVRYSELGYLCKYILSKEICQLGKYEKTLNLSTVEKKKITLINQLGPKPPKISGSEGPALEINR
jgi:hypothetical protein